VSVHAIVNAYWEPLAFALPAMSRQPWRRWIDTSLESPDDIVEWEAAPAVVGPRYRAEPRSVVVLYADLRTIGRHARGEPSRQ
jgi:glycogen operon protein